MHFLRGREAFEALFRSQADKLHRMAYHFLHDSGAAEDAVQEAFTLGLAHLHTYRGESSPEVWLYSIALNVCRQAIRKSRIDDRREEAAKEKKSLGRGPLTSVLRRETASRLAIALGHLTDLQREVFILHFVEELPYDQIGPMLGVSTVGARGLALRAREKLKKRLPPSFELPG